MTKRRPPLSREVPSELLQDGIKHTKALSEFVGDFLKGDLKSLPPRQIQKKSKDSKEVVGNARRFLKATGNLDLPPSVGELPQLALQADALVTFLKSYTNHSSLTDFDLDKLCVVMAATLEPTDVTALPLDVQNNLLKRKFDDCSKDYQHQIAMLSQDDEQGAGMIRLPEEREAFITEFMSKVSRSKECVTVTQTLLSPLIELVPVPRYKIWFAISWFGFEYWGGAS